VVVEPFLGCGHCYPCRIGKPNCCANLRVIGMHRDGGFAEYVIAPVDRLHPVPQNLSLFEAAFAEPVAIGVQCCRRAEVTAADTILILGAGPIGLALVEVAHARGARTVITDIDPARLEVAAALGATTITAGDGLLDEVMRLTNGEGMPVVMEATGSPVVAESTANLVAAGGRVVIIGIIKGGARVSFPGAELVSKEMTIVGSRASVDCFPESLNLLAGRSIHYPKIATRFALDQGPSVFDDIVTGKPLHKAVFVEAA
jgi:L-gulonate 5-dehydrogenase